MTLMFERSRRERRKGDIVRRLLLFILIAGIVAAPVWAKEGGDQYPNGAENWYAGAVPPPGSYYINYFGYYTGQLKNGSGAKVLLNGSTPSVNATFDAFRFVRMTHLHLFGADYGVHVIVPVVHQSVDLNGTAGHNGIGDTIVNPFILGWNRPRWHELIGVDIFLPTGYYDKNDARVSLGANYYGFDPLFAVSYMPPSGWEASVKLMYNLKTTNQATNYHSGQEFHTDYAAGRHLGKWMVGGTGYFLKQTTDDTINGLIAPASPGLWDAGRRGQVLAFGPSAGYTNSRHMIFMADWQHETLVRNRFGGDKFWFKMIIPIDSLLRGGRSR
jgi:hypothetical protein